MIYILFETRRLGGIEVTHFVRAYKYYEDAEYDCYIENMYSLPSIDSEFWIKKVELN